MRTEIDKQLSEFRQNAISFVAVMRRHLKADNKKTDYDLLQEVFKEIGIPFDIGIPTDKKKHDISLIVGRTAFFFKKGKFVSI